MNTLLGNEITETIRGIVYLCKFDRYNLTLTVTNELLFEKPGDALYAYAEIPNPESQLAYGKTYEDFLENLEELHKNMSDKNYLKELSDQI